MGFLNGVVLDFHSAVMGMLECWVMWVHGFSCYMGIKWVSVVIWLYWAGNTASFVVKTWK